MLRFRIVAQIQKLFTIQPNFDHSNSNHVLVFGPQMYKLISQFEAKHQFLVFTIFEVQLWGFGPCQTEDSLPETCFNVGRAWKSVNFNFTNNIVLYVAVL